jgi:predicted DNA binding CopG/RHH family protein
MYVPTRKALRKDLVVGVRISEYEMDLIKDSAHDAGLTLSSWCREIILDYLRMQSAQKPQKPSRKRYNK